MYSDGYDVLAGAFAVIVSLFVIGCIFVLPCIKWEGSEQVVSGIVYNTKTNKALTGNTTFSVRAGIDTYVSEENQSSYCLPPNSEFDKVVQKAAANKEIKVVVTTRKFFGLRAPWTCVDNITVTEETK